ncbi:hypothetical protein KAR91_28495 [Candidatus Pacearchaeota archaeon]|nr:hypothetical protein [Candidatus Pacearchaeota archaeon]
MTDKDDFKITEITIGAVRKCPTCGELPSDFRPAFSRRVENLFIIPAKSEHYTADKDGNPHRYYPELDTVSPPGLYTSVIVPNYYLGQVLLIKPEEE